MEFHMYFGFVIATTIMIAIPGPSVLLTVAHSISFGWKRGITTVAGATLGIAVQLVIAAIGLASLLHVVTGAFQWLRWIGAAYLVYLGIKQWRSAGKSYEVNASEVSNKSVFVKGLVTTTFNPKSLIFIASILPQFIDVSRPLGLQFIMIVPTFLAITFIVTSCWALMAGKLSDFLKSQRAQKVVSRTSGGLVILAGVGLALARKSQ